MKKLHERKKFKKLLFSKVSFVVVLIIVILLIRGVWGAYGKYSHSQKNFKIAENRLQELQEKEKSLQEEITYIKTDVGKKAIIVEKFNVAKEGERVIVVTNVPEELATTSQHKSSWWNDFLTTIRSLF